MVSPAMLIVALVIAIAIILFCIIVLKLNASIGMVLASLFMGVAGGLDLMTTMDTISSGFGSMMTSIGLPVGFGTILGQLMSDSGAADIIADKFPVSSKLGMVAIVVSCLIGIPLGIVAAYKRGSLIDRVDSLEKKLEKGIVVTQASGDMAAGTTGSSAASAVLKKKELPKAIPEDIKQIMSSWSGILSQLTGITRTYLKKAVPTLGEGGTLILAFEDANAYTYIEENRSNCQDEFRAAVAERLGKEVEILVKLNDTGTPSGEIYPDLRQLINFEIEEDDF